MGAQSTAQTGEREKFEKPYIYINRDGDEVLVEETLVEWRNWAADYCPFAEFIEVLDGQAADLHGPDYIIRKVRNTKELTATEAYEAVTSFNQNYPEITAAINAQIANTNLRMQQYHEELLLKQQLAYENTLIQQCLQSEYDDRARYIEAIKLHLNPDMIEKWQQLTEAQKGRLKRELAFRRKVGVTYDEAMGNHNE